MRSKSPPHVSPSAAIPCIYTADSSRFVSICCRRRRPGRRRRQGQRQKQRHQQQTCRREKIALPPNNKGKKKTQWPRVASLLLGSTKWTESVWLPPAGPVTNKKTKQTITISLFFRWTACNTSILSRPFASAANKRIFHLCFKRINGPAPLDWIIVDQLRYIDEIPLPSLPLVHHISISIYIWEWRGTLQLRDLVGYKRTRRHFFPPFLPAIEGGNRAWFTTLHR